MKAKRLATSTDPGFEHPRVDPEFLAYIPLRDGIDEDHLTVMLMTEGCRERVVVWDEENIVVDGHRRSKICQKHDIPYRVEYRHFADRAAVKEWMRHNQLYGKRNLTDKERSYLIGSEAGDSEYGDGKKETVAKKNKVSRRKVTLDVKFARAVDAHEAVNPGIKKQILAGEIKKTKVLATAPQICPRCIRCGIAKGCSACADLRIDKAKRTKAPPKPAENLLDTLKPVKGAKGPPPVVDPFEELKSLTTKLAGLFTRFLTAEGEVAARMCEYFGWCGLLDFGPKGGVPKFIPLAGVRALIEMAGSKGAKLKQADVLEAYKQACGAVPFVPPATKYRREQKARAS